MPVMLLSGSTFILTLLINGSTHEVHHAYARNLYRILERKEQAGMATVFPRYASPAFGYIRDLNWRSGLFPSWPRILALVASLLDNNITGIRSLT